MKKFNYLVLLLLVALIIPKQVHAEEVTQEIGYVDEQKDMMFQAVWTNDREPITLISPSGKEYDPVIEVESESESTLGCGFSTEQGVYVFMQNAEIGQWKVRYDKNPDNELRISFHEDTVDLIIQRFALSEVNNSSITVNFLVEDSEDYLNYHYEISAVADKSGDALVLDEGYATANELTEKTVDLSKLNSYDGYMLKLYVTCRKNDRDFFDMVYSEPFSYTSSDSLTNEVDYSVIIDKANYSASISYPDLPWGAEYAVVAMFEDDASEPAQYDKYTTSANTVNYMFDASTKKLRFEFSYEMDGRHTTPSVKTADLEASPNIVFPTDDVSNASSITIAYSNCDGQLASIYVNKAEEPKQLVLTGNGDFNLAVGEDWSDIVINYPVSDTLSYEYIYNVFIDRNAPKLTMYEDYTNVRTDLSEYTIMGMASNCESLTIQDTAVELKKNGEFSYTVAVADGTNIVPIVASDVVGNEAIYTATIVKGDGNVINPSDGSVQAMSSNTKNEKSGYVLQDFILLIVSVIVALVVVILALKFWKKPTNPTNNSNGKRGA